MATVPSGWAYTGHANDLEFGMANASGLESIDSAAPTVISKNTTSTQSFTATFSYVYDASQITPSTYGYCLDTDHTPSIGDAASCETLSPVDNSATISLSSGERVKNYIRPYMTDSNGVTYYSSTGISVTTCPDTATSLFWWNSEDNSLVRWKNRRGRQTGIRRPVHRLGLPELRQPHSVVSDLRDTGRNQQYAGFVF